MVQPDQLVNYVWFLVNFGFLVSSDDCMTLHLYIALHKSWPITCLTPVTYLILYVCQIYSFQECNDFIQHWTFFFFKKKMKMIYFPSVIALFVLLQFLLSRTPMVPQCMPQSLNYFSLHQYALDDRVWAGVTRKLKYSARQCMHCEKNLWGIVEYTVVVWFCFNVCKHNLYMAISFSCWRLEDCCHLILCLCCGGSFPLCHNSHYYGQDGKWMESVWIQCTKAHISFH